MRVAICDYGAGNMRSVQLAFERLGCVVSMDNIGDADLAVLPGVGSAASAMRGLRARGLDEELRERVRDGRPTLGICLGLQLALEESEEDGGTEGLGLLPGRAVRLREGRVPRMGWAVVEPQGSIREPPMQSIDGSVGGTSAVPPSPLLPRRDVVPPRGEAFYFAHSYAAETAAATAWSEGVVAEARSGSFVGVQFHPEKSGAAGARWLEEQCLSLV